MKNRMWWIAIGLLLIAGIVVLVKTRPGGLSGEQELSRVEKQERERETAEKEPVPDSKAELAKALGIDESELELVGGIWRPKRDRKFDRSVKSERNTDKPQRIADLQPKTPQPGVAPRLRGDENEQVAGLMAELRGKETNSKDSEDSARPSDSNKVVSTWFKPQVFDRAAYAANPDAYLNKIRPARVFDPAQPGEDVTPLEPISNGFHELLQGEQVVLRVKADSGMPVAFYTNAASFFTENLLKTVTVKADENGIATATFKAAKGTMGIVDVMAASPVHSRQLQFRVNVLLPDQNQASNN